MFQFWIIGITFCHRNIEIILLRYYKSHTDGWLNISLSKNFTQSTPIIQDKGCPFASFQRQKFLLVWSLIIHKEAFQKSFNLTYFQVSNSVKFMVSMKQVKTISMIVCFYSSFSISKVVRMFQRIKTTLFIGVNNGISKLKSLIF